MKKLMTCIVFALLTMSIAPVNANNPGYVETTGPKTGGELKLDRESSNVNWRGTKPTGEHYGTVKIKEGNLEIDGNKVSGGSFVIDLNSIYCEDLSGGMKDKLEGHLKSEDFFYTEEYPYAKFKITRLSKIGGEIAEGPAATHMATGDLDMRGKVNSISFPVSINVSDNGVSIKAEEFSIDRTKWGVNFKSKSVFAELKDNFIGDKMFLKLDVRFEAK